MLAALSLVISVPARHLSEQSTGTSRSDNARDSSNHRNLPSGSAATIQEEATMPPCHTGGSPDSTHLSLSTFSVQDREERLLQEDGAELLEEEVEEAEEEEPYVPPVAAAARTADELRAAIVAGTQHIVIKNHLDLTNLEAVDDEFGNIITLPIVPKTVQSITGDCRTRPRVRDFSLFSADKGPVEIQRRQCLIVTDNSFVATSSNLWISKVYVHLTQPDDDAAIRFASDGSPLEWPKPLFVRALDDSNLWMTEVTMQGDGTQQVKGLDASSAIVAEDCIFSQLGGLQPAITVRGDGTTAAFSRTQFLHNGESDKDVANSVIATSGATAVWIQGCTFIENAAEHTLADFAGSATFFSDQQLPVWLSDTDTTENTAWLNSTPDSIQFLNTSDPWLLATREEVIVAANLFNTDGFPGPLGVWSFAAVMMAVAAILIAAVVYFLPEPPQLQEPTIPRNNSSSMHTRSRAEYHRQHSRSSTGSRRSNPTDRELGLDSSSRIHRAESRGRSQRFLDASEAYRSPRHEERSVPFASRSRASPRQVETIHERGNSFMESNASNRKDEVATTSAGHAEGPQHLRHGTSRERVSTSTTASAHNSSVTFAKGSGAALRQLDSRLDSRLEDVEHMTSSGGSTESILEENKVDCASKVSVDMEQPDDVSEADPWEI